MYEVIYNGHAYMQLQLVLLCSCKVLFCSCKGFITYHLYMQKFLRRSLSCYIELATFDSVCFCLYYLLPVYNTLWYFYIYCAHMHVESMWWCQNDILLVCYTHVLRKKYCSALKQIEQTLKRGEFAELQTTLATVNMTIVRYRCVSDKSVLCK